MRLGFLFACPFNDADNRTIVYALTAFDSVDGSSTGTAKKWVLLRPHHAVEQPCKQLRRSVSILRSRYFRCAALTQRARCSLKVLHDSKLVVASATMIGFGDPIFDKSTRRHRSVVAEIAVNEKCQHRYLAASLRTPLVGMLCGRDAPPRVAARIVQNDCWLPAWRPTVRIDMFMSQAV